MKFKANSFVWLYSLLVLFDLACGGFEVLANFRVLSKPLIVLSLLVYFIYSTRSHRNSSFYLMIAALLCSLMGDVFLMFDHKSGLYFTLGLASFLIAHVLYTLTFIKKWNKQEPTNFKWVAYVLVSYALLLFFVLKNSLGSLQIPVILYVLGIMGMAITAYRRKGRVPQSSFNLVFMGALFFVLSDSVLAINKFMAAVPLSHIIVMGSYATAQYLITKGVITQGGFNN